MHNKVDKIMLHRPAHIRITKNELIGMADDKIEVYMGEKQLIVIARLGGTFGIVNEKNILAGELNISEKQAKDFIRNDVMCIYAIGGI